MRLQVMLGVKYSKPDNIPLFEETEVSADCQVQAQEPEYPHFLGITQARICFKVCYHNMFL